MSEPFANLEATEQLSAYLDDELSADERRAVEASLADDGDLRAELEMLAEARAFLADHGAVSAPAGFLDDVLAAVDDEPEVVDLGWFQRMRRASRQTLGVPIEGIAVAAAALLVVWIALPGGSAPDSAPADQAASKTQGMGSSLSERVDNDAVTDAALPDAKDAPPGADAVDTGLNKAADLDGEAKKKLLPKGYRGEASEKERAELEQRKAEMDAKAEMAARAAAEEAMRAKKGGAADADDLWGGPAKNLADKSPPPTEEADGEAAPEGTRFARVPYSYQLTTDDPEVLYRLAAIAAKHRGEVTDSEAQSLEVTELTGSDAATVLVKLPSHALQEFGREIAALGMVTATTDNTMFAGDPVEVRVRVQLASGAAEGDGSAPNTSRKNRAAEQYDAMEVEEAL
jgi:anti-sigma factor RsiW